VLIILLVCCVLFLLFNILVRLHIYSLFPYTTLFRSNFRDFTIDQLLKIAKQMVAEREYELIPEAEWKLRTHLLKLRNKTYAQFRSEEHTSELQSRFDLVCRLLLEKKKMVQKKVIKYR